MLTTYHFVHNVIYRYGVVPKERICDTHYAFTLTSEDSDRRHTRYEKRREREFHIKIWKGGIEIREVVRQMCKGQMVKNLSGRQMAEQDQITRSRESPDINYQSRIATVSSSSIKQSCFAYPTMESHPEPPHFAMLYITTGAKFFSLSRPQTVLHISNSNRVPLDSLSKRISLHIDMCIWTKGTRCSSAIYGREQDEHWLKATASRRRSSSIGRWVSAQSLLVTRNDILAFKNVAVPCECLPLAFHHWRSELSCYGIRFLHWCQWCSFPNWRTSP